MKAVEARIAYIHSDTPNNVRVSKCLQTFRKLFSQVAYIGCWRNRPWDGAGGVDAVSYHLLDARLERGTSSLTGIPAFLRHARAILLKFQPDVVVMTNEDLLPCFALNILPKPHVLVCDLIDSIATRIVGPVRHLQPMWSSLSVWGRMVIDGIVEVTDDRLRQHRVLPRHQAVILNSPPWSEIAPRPDVPPDSIYVCGSIVDNMSGVEALLDACEGTPYGIVFAGRPIGKWVNEIFAKHPRVRFLGEVSPEESLQIAAASTALFAHYNPTVRNHIFAAPNKLYDAMLVGVPLLINRECRISEFAECEGFGLLTPYGSVTALKSALSEMSRRRHALEISCAAARQKFRTEYCWDVMEDRWRSFFRGLGVRGLMT